MSCLAARARQSIGLLDLTNLNEECSEADIDALAARARTPFGNVAALCIWPHFVARAGKLVSGSGIRVATVVNFPKGDDRISTVAASTEAALAAGAGEIDAVMPYRLLLAGDAMAAAHFVAAMRRAVPAPHCLKIIVESGILRDRGHILLASTIALAEGADFIKTSTGKAATHATLEAAEIMIGAIRRGGFPAGFKAAGGIRTAPETASYLDLAAAMMGEGWARPSTFRFGASGVLDGLIAAASGKAFAASSGY